MSLKSCVVVQEGSNIFHDEDDIENEIKFLSDCILSYTRKSTIKIPPSINVPVSPASQISLSPALTEIDMLPLLERSFTHHKEDLGEGAFGVVKSGIKNSDPTDMVP
eukprot:UN08309